MCVMIPIYLSDSVPPTDPEDPPPPASDSEPPPNTAEPSPPAAGCSPFVIAFAFCGAAIFVGVSNALSGFGGWRNPEYLLPWTTWLSLLCMLLGAVEAAVRQPKGSDPWLAATVCIMSAISGFLLAYTRFSPEYPTMGTVFGLLVLGLWFLAVWSLVRDRCVLGVAGVTSFIMNG
jgi:hypothetical protein